MGASVPKGGIPYAFFSHAILFGLVYNISFLAMPILSTSRIAMLWLLITQRRRLQEGLAEFLRDHPVPAAVFLAALAYAAAGFVFSGRIDSTQVSRQFHFILYSVVGAMLYMSHLDGDRNLLLKRFGRIAFIQSVLIIYSLFDFAYREWLVTVLVQGGNIGLAEGFRPPGFTNSTGATLAVIQALGFFSALWSGYHAKGFFSAAAWYFAASLGMVSALLTGRTGLLLCGLFGMAFCVQGLLHRRLALPITMILLSCLVFAFGQRLLESLAALPMADLPDFTRIMDWALEFFVSGSETGSIQNFSGMKIPPLSWETMVGTGTVYIENRRASMNDSGYIQNYFALGLLMAGAFYAAFGWHLLCLWRGAESKFLLAVLGISMFLIEVKEPFIFKYVLPFFVLCLFASRRYGRLSDYA